MSCIDKELWAIPDQWKCLCVKSTHLGDEIDRERESESESECNELSWVKGWQEKQSPTWITNDLLFSLSYPIPAELNI